MSEPRRRLIEVITDPTWVDELESKPIEELRAMRDDAREVENEASFERRLCQARIDILTAELESRTSAGGGDLVSRLPQILSTEGEGDDETSDAPLPSRAPDFSIPRSADVPRRRVEEIVGEQTLARLPEIDSDEIRGIIADLGEHERAVSARRREVHEIMDLVQGEIVRRYTSGEADPTAALG